MFKFETHLHSSACSACGTSTSKEMLDALKEKSYAGAVFTNHFYYGNTAIDRKLPWKSFVDAYERDFLEASEYGEKLGLKVFFGLEEGLGKGKEFLIYGISPNDLINCPDFIRMDLKEKSDFIHNVGGITVCAHPFRVRDYIVEPDAEPEPSYFDGVECFNFFNNQEENQKAFDFADKNGLLKLSGGDVHNAKFIGNAGIAFDEPIKDYTDFLNRIKQNDFTLIMP